jgi:hypothetical protein
MNRWLLALLFVALFANPSAADIYHLSANLDGAQANAGAGTGSPGTGTATVTYDSDTDLLSWTLSWSGLQGDETLCHFHGPALPDQNAGVQVDIFAIGGMVSPSVGNTVITPAQATDLLDGFWYINLHTTDFPGGEIRGQVTLERVVPASETSVSQWKAMYW